MTKIEAVGMSLVHFFWQGGLLLLLAWGLLFALRKKSAQARYLACCAVLVAMVAAPFVTAYILWPAAPLEPLRLTDLTTPATNLSPVTIQEIPQSFSPETLRLVVLGWLIGVGALTLRCLGGFLSLARLRRGGRSAVPDDVYARFVELAERMGVRKLPRIYVSARVAVPTVIGAFRGMILLPASALTGMSPQMLDTLLAHELAHVARFDFLVNAVQTLVEIVLFYHPAVWWLSNRIREERENCCDDLVVATLHDRKTYALALARVEELRLNPLALRANGGELLVRIRRILGEKQMKAIASPLSVAVLLGTLILVPALQSLAAVPDGATQTKPTVHHVKKKKKHTSTRSRSARSIDLIPARAAAGRPSVVPALVPDRPVYASPLYETVPDKRKQAVKALGMPKPDIAVPSEDVARVKPDGRQYLTPDKPGVADVTITQPVARMIDVHEMPGKAVDARGIPSATVGASIPAKVADDGREAMVQQIYSDIKSCMDERAELMARYRKADLQQVEAEIALDKAESALQSAQTDGERKAKEAEYKTARIENESLTRSKAIIKDHISAIETEIETLRRKLSDTSK